METHKKTNQTQIISKLNSLEQLLKNKYEKPFNFNQAADYLGFSHSYLYKLTSKNVIPHYKPNGKRIFFSKNELDNWIFQKNINKRK